VVENRDKVSDGAVGESVLGQCLLVQVVRGDVFFRQRFFVNVCDEEPRCISVAQIIQVRLGYLSNKGGVTGKNL
jgi:hypothetical protein